MSTMRPGTILIAAAVALASCARPDAPPGEPSISATPESPSGHQHHAPHGGTLVELGEEFAHIEALVDTAAGTLTVYVLDKEAERGVAIRTSRLHVEGEAVEIEAGATRPVSIHLMGVANPLTGETADSTSEFSAQSESLRRITQFSGVLHEITVMGRTFTEVAFRYPN